MIYCEYMKRKKYPSICNYDQPNKHIKEDYCNENDSDNVMTVKRNMISFAPPNKWGPKAWDFFHSVSFSYPVNPTGEQQQAALDFFKALPFMLPCSTCGKHCEQQLKQFPPDVKNRETLTKWLYNFHNLINQRLGKKMPSLTRSKENINHKCKYKYLHLFCILHFNVFHNFSI